MTNATDSTAHTSLLADLREKQEALEDAETYDALMKVLDTFEVVPSFETKRPMVDERLVRLVTQTLERFVVPFEDDGASSKKSDLKLSDEDYILRDSGVPLRTRKSNDGGRFTRDVREPTESHAGPRRRYLVTSAIESRRSSHGLEARQSRSIRKRERINKTTATRACIKKKMYWYKNSSVAA